MNDLLPSMLPVLPSLLSLSRGNAWFIPAWRHSSRRHRLTNSRHGSYRSGNRNRMIVPQTSVSAFRLGHMSYEKHRTGDHRRPIARRPSGYVTAARASTTRRSPDCTSRRRSRFAVDARQKKTLPAGSRQRIASLQLLQSLQKIKPVLMNFDV
ncbi:hypothetical protein ACVBGC_30370 [Burkholderia stagnalis]